MLGELVLVVDPHPAVRVLDDVQVEVDRPHASARSHSGGVVMSTYTRTGPPSSWNVASQPRSTGLPAPGTSPTWATGAT